MSGLDAIAPGLRARAAARANGAAANGPPPVLVAGKHDPEGWRVLALIGGFQVTLPPAAARALAAELTAMAEVCEGRRW